MDKVILITTPTSGTGSIRRLVERLISATRVHDKLDDLDPVKRNIRTSDISNILPNKNLYIINTHINLDFKKAPLDLKFIVNFRDPRDLVCNQFSWLGQHPVLQDGLGNQRREEERQMEARQKGIDNYVMSITEEAVHYYFDHILSFLEDAPQHRRLVISYAELCLDFWNMVERISLNITGHHYQDLKNVLLFRKNSGTYVELNELITGWSPEKIRDNKRWVGKKWSGSDIAPGRYLKELAPQSIDHINKVTHSVRNRLIEYERDSLRKRLLH